MNLLDFKGEMGEYLLDEDRKIPKAHLNSICKIYKQCLSCRYIFLSPKNGFVCVKKTPIKKTLDAIVAKKEMTAQGDNCEGLGNYQKDNG
jgi:hypothetical protein